MSIRFRPEAEAELIDAAAWYEAAQRDLSQRFLATVHDSLERVEINPLLYPLVEGDVRRCLTRTFPFGRLFRFGPGLMAIMAVMRLHRDPNYWRYRRFDLPASAE
ncbi:type II toxin-antitoxin system RelE/ParE family toxin [Candidatus Sumerlaeota bacterium]|nr:type II toxin-antitoxin system RelE/ParE family toxin [Candidatus Sumerlaeota bacterium]